MDVSDVKSAASFVLVRLGWGALASSAAVLGGVYFIVDNVLRGLENSVDGVRSQIQMQSASLNTRIDDLTRSLNEKIDLKFELLNQKLDGEFSDTRKEIKKADLQFNGLRFAPNKVPFIEMKFVDIGSYRMRLNPSAPTLASILMADPTFANWAKIASNVDELKRLQADGVVVQAKLATGGPEVKWFGKSPIAAVALADWMRQENCVGIMGTVAGKSLVVPTSEQAIVGSDGIFCKPAQ
jgi:hypothetical protein